MRFIYIQVRRLITFLLVASTIISVLSGFKFLEVEYTRKGMIVNVIEPCKAHKDGLVTFIDKDGNLWDFEGSEDWIIGDFLEATMSDNGTVDYIEDDYIVTKDGNAKAIYTGHLSQLMKDNDRINSWLQ